MTPKIIHYCWFGNSVKPKDVVNYIEGWRQALPDYNVVEWNESNFDVNSCVYCAQAYAEKKYAFVSDYARLHALYFVGGIYLDTDVAVLGRFDDFLDGKIVLGFEEFNYVATSTMIAPKGSDFIGDWLKSYHTRSFKHDDGTIDQTTNVQVLTLRLSELGLERDGKRQSLRYMDQDILVAEQVIFSPLDYPNGIDKSDDSTVTIHHFGQSWASRSGLIRRKLKDFLVLTLGGQRIKMIRDFLKTIFK